MTTVFSLLAIAALIFFVYSIFKKSDHKKRNLWSSAIVMLVSFFIVGTLNPAPKEKKDDKPKTEKVAKKNVAKKDKKKSDKSDKKKDTKNNHKKKPSKKDTTSKKKNIKKDRSSTYEIDKIVKDTDVSHPGIMTFDEYSDFVVGRFTLESAIAKYGMPTHSIGGAKGDVAIEVTFPTEEKGYSADLHFKPNKKNGFGNWVLSKKESVVTKGIGFSKYTKP